MKFLSVVRTGFTSLLDFGGTASRSEFWLWVLFCLLLLAITNTIDGMVIAPAQGYLPFEADAGQPLSLVTCLLLALPTISFASRRLHDSGLSTWWLLLAVTVILLPILFYFLVRKGRQPSANQIKRG